MPLSVRSISSCCNCRILSARASTDCGLARLIAVFRLLFSFFRYSSLLPSISLIASTNASCKVSSLTVRAEQRVLSSSLVLHRQTIVFLPRLFQCSLRKCSPQHSQVTMCEKAWFALNPCRLPFISRSDDRRAISSCTLMNISFGMIASWSSSI